MRFRTGATLKSAIGPFGLLAGVLALDAVRSRLPFNVIVTGGLDELCHLATAGLALCAATSTLTSYRHRTLVLSALGASMAIDVDHLPLYAGFSHFATNGRPYTHSLATVAVTLVFASVMPGARPVLSGTALGFLLHFVRDIATGPGLPLWWPFTGDNVRVDYDLYIAVLCVLAVCASLRGTLPARLLGPRWRHEGSGR